MSGERDDFLSRWSRRKIEVRQETSQVNTLAGAALPEPAQPPTASGNDLALTPDEIAALPKIDELTPETDITVFLRKGVPEFLKNAALRRMWSLDPSIRDYVGDARDYAYDWNVLGGVPGNGPLLPGDDVEAMVGQTFGDGPRVSERLRAAGEEEWARGAPPSEDASTNVDRSTDEPCDAIEDAAPQHRELSPPTSVGALRPPAQDGGTINPMLPSHSPDVALPSNANPAAPAAASPRRHGGAKPV